MSKNYEPFVAETSNPTLPVGAIYYDTVIEVCGRLLRDSHLDLKIETLKENSRLILDLNKS